MEEHTKGVNWMFSRTDMQRDGYWHDHKWEREGLEQRRENMKNMKGGTISCAKSKNKLKSQNF